MFPSLMQPELAAAHRRDLTVAADTRRLARQVPRRGGGRPARTGSTVRRISMRPATPPAHA